MNVKTRKWCITINDGAESWYEFRDVINNQSRCKYAYIVHDKDNEKQPHVHIVLNYENARLFNGMVEMFKGAHVEPCKFYNQSIRYLIHKDDDDKFQYDFDEIITNYKEDELKIIMDSDEFEKLDTETILCAIRDGSVHNITTAITRWGLYQVKTHQRIIETLINENRRLVGLDEEKCAMNARLRELEEELSIYREFYGDIREKERLKELYE